MKKIALAGPGVGSFAGGIAEPITGKGKISAKKLHPFIAGIVVAIEAEEIHDTRIIRVDGSPHLPKNIRQWTGDSIGHWEGNTLIVDTTNFTDRTPFEGARNLHVTERFTRSAEDTIVYQFTVEDPGMWTKPWSGEVLVKKIPGPLWEYACHEANYGLENTLRGARVAEKEAAAKK